MIEFRKFKGYKFAMAVGIGCILCSCSPDEPEAAPKKTNSVSADTVAAAEKAIKSEPKVKDVIYNPDKHQWLVGVEDDGTRRVGYAEYICLLLNEHKALEPDTFVEIVDVATMRTDQGFGPVSLGRALCPSS